MSLYNLALRLSEEEGSSLLQYPNALVPSGAGRYLKSLIQSPTVTGLGDLVIESSEGRHQIDLSRCLTPAGR